MPRSVITCFGINNPAGEEQGRQPVDAGAGMGVRAIRRNGQSRCKGDQIMHSNG